MKLFMWVNPLFPFIVGFLIIAVNLSEALNKRKNVSGATLNIGIPKCLLIGLMSLKHT